MLLILVTVLTANTVVLVLAALSWRSGLLCVAWCKWSNFYREIYLVECFATFALRKWELFRNYLRMEFGNTFDNCEKLRNGISTIGHFTVACLVTWPWA